MDLTYLDYLPAIRAGKYDLLALTELEDERKKRVFPLISVRGNEKQLEQFATKWGDFPFWVDSSRFPQDASDPLAAKLNKSEGNFSEKQELLKKLKKLNDSTLPVVGFRPNDSTRHVVQFALFALSEFPLCAIRMEVSGKGLERSIATTRAVLNAVADSDIRRVVLILDLASITDTPYIDDGSSVGDVLNLADEYLIDKVITLSTSWPDDRPERGETRSRYCLDPIWQTQLHSSNADRGIKFFYGDYAATNPLRDMLDTFDPTKMSAPIPFAGYFAPFIWSQAKHGRSGENEAFREIARYFQGLTEYHGDDFCWGTKQIAAIASNNRESPGNMAFWNKIRINQHICGILQAIDDNVFSYLSDSGGDSSDLDDDEPF